MTRHEKTPLRLDSFWLRFAKSLSFLLIFVAAAGLSGPFYNCFSDIIPLPLHLFSLGSFRKNGYCIFIAAICRVDR